MKKDTNDSTIIICCAGMGTRLGIGTTKALVNICGKPLIIRLLEQLDEFADVRIVVGYDAERVIQTVKKYRDDIMFVFNYDYETTGVADSLKKALLGANDNIVAIDGDTIFNNLDLHKIFKHKGEFIVLSENATEEPIVANIDGKKVLKLSKDKDNGDLHWSGVIKINKYKLKGDGKHVYEILNKQLPMNFLKVRLKEINTQVDYENAIIWFDKGCCD